MYFLPINFLSSFALYWTLFQTFLTLTLYQDPHLCPPHPKPHTHPAAPSIWFAFLGTPPTHTHTYQYQALASVCGHPPGCSNEKISWVLDLGQKVQFPETFRGKTEEYTALVSRAKVYIPRSCPEEKLDERCAMEHHVQVAAALGLVDVPLGSQGSAPEVRIMVLGPSASWKTIALGPMQFTHSILAQGGPAPAQPLSGNRQHCAVTLSGRQDCIVKDCSLFQRQ